MERIKQREKDAQKSENEEDMERKAIIDEFKENQKDINEKKYIA